MDKYDDAFTVEVAWSRDGCFPSCPATDSGEEQNAESAAVRICNLVSVTGRDLWWVLAAHDDSMRRFEQIVIQGDEDALVGYLLEDPLGPKENALARVDAEVTSAMDVMTEFMVPYFCNVATRFGHNWA